MGKYRSKEAAIIAAKRKRRAERPAVLIPVHTPDLEIQPTRDESDLESFVILWKRFEKAKGPHLIWRIDQLRNRMARDDERRRDVQIKMDHKGHVMRTEKSYHEWAPWERKLLSSVRGATRTNVMPTDYSFHDIVRLVKSPTGEGTICDPVYKTISLWFSGGGGIHGKEYSVKSLCKILDASTPRQMVKWLCNMLPRVESGELDRLVKLIETNHGNVRTEAHVGQNNVTSVQAEMIRDHAANLLVNQVVRSVEYARVRKRHHWKPESCVGPMRNRPSRKKYSREKSENT